MSFQQIIYILSITVFTAACGVKGRPEAPLRTEKDLKKKELEVKKKDQIKKKKNEKAQ